MTNGSRVFFGLRSNAASLVAGRGVASVRRRIMVGALLHDEVLLESDVYTLNAGAVEYVEWHLPPCGEEERRWQTPRERAAASLGPMRLGTSADEPPEDTALLIAPGVPRAIGWRATLEPFFPARKDMPDWVSFVRFEDCPDEMSRTTSIVARSDMGDPALVARWPDVFVRYAVAQGAASDLVHAARIGASISIDALHWHLLAAKIHRNEAARVPGVIAIKTLDPATLSWGELDELRRTRGFREYRKILFDIEAEALSGGASIAEMRQRIIFGYGEALGRARSHLPSGRGHAAALVIGFVAGELAGIAAAGVPLLGGLGGAAAGEAASHVAASVTAPRWLAVHERLRLATIDGRQAREDT